MLQEFVHATQEDLFRTIYSGLFIQEDIPIPQAEQRIYTYLLDVHRRD